MRKWIVLAWLLVPVGFLSYHFGPGQEALAWREAQTHFGEARKLDQQGHLDEAIDEYQQTLNTLPAVGDASNGAIARDQLRLAQIRARFQLGHLAESIDELRMLADEVERNHGPDSPLTYDVRDLLGRVHFQAMIALRLESADEQVWKRHWELARQNFRSLAERTPRNRNLLDRKNLEAVIKSADLPVEAFAAPAGSATGAGGFTPATASLAPAPRTSQPTTADARPKTKPSNNNSQIDPPEFKLGY